MIFEFESKHDPKKGHTLTYTCKVWGDERSITDTQMFENIFLKKDYLYKAKLDCILLNLEHYTAEAKSFVSDDTPIDVKQAIERMESGIRYFAEKQSSFRMVCETVLKMEKFLVIFADKDIKSKSFQWVNDIIKFCNDEAKYTKDSSTTSGSGEL